jgi:hypothetical protein
VPDCARAARSSAHRSGGRHSAGTRQRGREMARKLRLPAGRRASRPELGYHPHRPRRRRRHAGSVRHDAAPRAYGLAWDARGCAARRRREQRLLLRSSSSVARRARGRRARPRVRTRTTTGDRSTARARRAPGGGAPWVDAVVLRARSSIAAQGATSRRVERRELSVVRRRAGASRPVRPGAVRLGADAPARSRARAPDACATVCAADARLVGRSPPRSRRAPSPLAAFVAEPGQCNYWQDEPGLCLKRMLAFCGFDPRTRATLHAAHDRTDASRSAATCATRRARCGADRASRTRTNPASRARRAPASPSFARRASGARPRILLAGRVRVGSTARRVASVVAATARRRGGPRRRR